MHHTIDEAASLVGRTRRSIYRAMTAGRLAYSVEHDGRRYVDTTELLRVYGPFVAVSQPVTPGTSHGVTGRGTGAGRPAAGPQPGAESEGHTTMPPDAVDALVAAVERLTAEVAALRSELAAQRLLLEHKPVQFPPKGGIVSAPGGADQPLPPAQRERTAGQEKTVRSFADLLDSLGD